jgi:hypothetical protein
LEQKDAKRFVPSDTKHDAGVLVRKKSNPERKRGIDPERMWEASVNENMNISRPRAQKRTPLERPEVLEQTGFGAFVEHNLSASHSALMRKYGITPSMLRIDREKLMRDDKEGKRIMPPRQWGMHDVGPGGIDPYVLRLAKAAREPAPSVVSIDLGPILASRSRELMVRNPGELVGYSPFGEGKAQARVAAEVFRIQRKHPEIYDMLVRPSATDRKNIQTLMQALHSRSRQGAPSYAQSFFRLLSPDYESKCDGPWKEEPVCDVKVQRAQQGIIQSLARRMGGNVNGAIRALNQVYTRARGNEFGNTAINILGGIGMAQGVMSLVNLMVGVVPEGIHFNPDGSPYKSITFYDYDDLYY